MDDQDLSRGRRGIDLEHELEPPPSREGWTHVLDRITSDYIGPDVIDAIRALAEIVAPRCSTSDGHPLLEGTVVSLGPVEGRRGIRDLDTFSYVRPALRDDRPERILGVALHTSHAPRIGVSGILSARCDSTVEHGDWCAVGEPGILTKAPSGWYVLERVSDDRAIVSFGRRFG